MKMSNQSIHNLCLSIALAGLAMVGQTAWACEKPAVRGYSYVDCLSEGLATVEKDGKYGYVDKTGKEVIPLSYQYAGSFSEGLADVEKDGKYGYIDKTGKEVIPLIYQGAWGFNEGLAAVKKDGKWGFIDVNGKTVIPFRYDGISPFYNGKAPVSFGDDGKTPKLFYIDKTGKILTHRTSLAEFRKNLKQGDDVYYLAADDLFDSGRGMIIEIKGNLVQIQIKEEYPSTKWVKKSEVYPDNHFD